MNLLHSRLRDSLRRRKRVPLRGGLRRRIPVRLRRAGLLPRQRALHGSLDRACKLLFGMRHLLLRQSLLLRRGAGERLFAAAAQLVG